MLIKDKIYIDLSKEPVPIPQDILKLLTYKNPDYYQKMNMGLSVWNIDKDVKTYELKDRMFTVLRGEFSKIRPYVKSDIVTDHPKFEPVDLEYVNNDFDLDEYQEGAVQAILSRKQGVIHAVTSAGKSLIILKAICEKKLPALIVVHRKILMQQFLEDIEKYVRTKDGKRIAPNIISGGSKHSDTPSPITISIDKSLSIHLEKYKEKFGVVFQDECHLAPADNMLKLINSLNSEFRFGVSGTLKRKDQKEFLIFATFGGVIYKITKEQLLAMKRVVPVEIVITESQTQFDYEGAIEEYGVTKAYQLMEKTLSLCPDRNERIVDLIAGIKNQKTIVLSKLVQPCYELQKKLLDKHGIKSGVLTGRNSKEALESYEQMKHKNLEVIFATIGCVSTGVSISDLDNIVLISPLYTNELLLHQIRGRLMRISPGKTKGTLYYVYDPYIFPQKKLNKFLSIMDL